MIPVSLILLAIIALVLHILFEYLVVQPDPRPRYFRTFISIIVIIIVLLLWFVLPVHVG